MQYISRITDPSKVNPIDQDQIFQTTFFTTHFRPSNQSNQLIWTFYINRSKHTREENPRFFSNYSGWGVPKLMKNSNRGPPIMGFYWIFMNKYSGGSRLIPPSHPPVCIQFKQIRSARGREKLIGNIWSICNSF